MIQPSYIGNGIEYENYPPTLYGAEKLILLKNLVDIFPAKDGYPIDKSDIYNPENHMKIEIRDLKDLFL